MVLFKPGSHLPQSCTILHDDKILFKYHFSKQEYAKSHQYLVWVDGMFSISALPS